MNSLLPVAPIVAHPAVHAGGPVNMNIIHPLDIAHMVLTNPLAICFYFVAVFGVGFVVGKWTGSYG